MIDSNIYKRTIETWGADSQLGMMQEECAELISSINKWRRGKITPYKIIEECVDVEIMLAQMKVIFSENELWNKLKLRKLERLLYLLSKEVKNGQKEHPTRD